MRVLENMLWGVYMSKNLFTCIITLILGVQSSIFCTAGASPYDFFKEPRESITQASEYAKKSLTIPESEAAQLVLFLEKMRARYYEHLDNLETASLYWEWAKNHPLKYAASQLPHKWFRTVTIPSEAERICTKIDQLRTTYSVEFGAIMRLLAARHVTGMGTVLWISDVRKSLAQLLRVNSITELASIELLIEKFSRYEQGVTGAIHEVQVPSWAERHWIPLTITALAAGVGAYYYYNNTLQVDGLINKSFVSLKNIWVNYFITPVTDLKNELLKAMQLDNPIRKQEVTKMSEDLQDKFLSSLESDLKESWFVARLASNTTIKQGIDLARLKLNGLDQLADQATDTLAIGKNHMHSLTPTATLLRLVFAFGAAKICYSSTAFAYRWFTKKDRGLLRLRLCQVEEVLIRSMHETTMSDGEYGRLVYLLTKEYDQVPKNVLLDERHSFLNDLAYLADTQPSIMQKQKTLDSMWRKYRSLAKPA